MRSSIYPYIDRMYNILHTADLIGKNQIIVSAHAAGVNLMGVAESDRHENAGHDVECI